MTAGRAISYLRNFVFLSSDNLMTILWFQVLDWIPFFKGMTPRNCDLRSKTDDLAPQHTDLEWEVGACSAGDFRNFVVP